MATSTHIPAPAVPHHTLLGKLLMITTMLALMAMVVLGMLFYAAYVQDQSARGSNAALIEGEGDGTAGGASGFVITRDGAGSHTSASATGPGGSSDSAAGGTGTTGSTGTTGGTGGGSTGSGGSGGTGGSGGSTGSGSSVGVQAGTGGGSTGIRITLPNLNLPNLNTGLNLNLPVLGQ